jgi:hypothetical protein
VEVSAEVLENFPNLYIKLSFWVSACTTQNEESFNEKKSAPRQDSFKSGYVVKDCR